MCNTCEICLEVLGLRTLAFSAFNLQQLVQDIQQLVQDL